MVIKILKILLLISLLLLGALVVIGAVLSMGWPLWVGGFLLTGLLGLGLGGVFLKKLLLRRREQHFVNQVIAQDEAYVKSLGEKERRNSQALQDRWKEAVDALRASHLKKLGNPLYVLPWYMIIGESGSGKTTAIKSARLSSPFAEISSTSGISGTRNCDWWFFEKAVLIDTAGRYAIPVDEGRDKEEWHKFLSLLIKFRKKEPLNGLVVTIAADKLANDSPDALAADGKNIRRRIDELMKVLGAKFPVYVMVTKCDLIKGMTEFCDSLPESAHNQAMGILNRELSFNIPVFLEKTFKTMLDRLKDLRLILLGKSGGEADAGLMVFSEEFEKLKSGLDAFMASAFAENPYLETPILRGLYFSSGRQEGRPYSNFLRDMGLIEQKDVLPGTSKGLFLHDLFSRILPADRGLFAPTHRSLEWRRVTRNIGLTAWLAIALSVCGLLSFSFVKNMKTIQDAASAFSSPLLLKNDLRADTIALNRFLEAVKQVESENRSWWIPRLGLTESRGVEAKLKKRFCRYYADDFLMPYDKRMTQDMSRFTADMPEEVIGRHICHLVRRINRLKAKLEGGGADAMSKWSPPAFDGIGPASETVLVANISQKLTDLYDHYLLWEEDKAALGRQAADLQAWLKHILALDGITLNWLVQWTNADPNLPPVSMADFWGGAGSDVRVSPAFTLAGKKRISAFIGELESALDEPLAIARQKQDFAAWYNRCYLDAWHDFAAAFSTGPDLLAKREDWQRMAARVGTAKDPYFSFFSKMAEELEPISKARNRPAWVEVVFGVKTAKMQSAALKAENLKEEGLLGKAAQKLTTGLEKVEKATGIGTDAVFNMKDKLAAGSALAAYRQALSEIAPSASSGTLAYQTAAAFYGSEQDPAANDSALYRAYNAASALRRMLAEPGADVGEMEALLTGPAAFLHEFVCRETACYLQHQWETDLLTDIKGISGLEYPDPMLMGPNGPVRKFVEGPAAPFLTRDFEAGYLAKTVAGRQVAFNPAFLSYLTKSDMVSKTMGESYSVTVRGEPTGANPDAEVIPHSTVLELQCPANNQRLVNYSYPISQTFRWSPKKCGDVQLQINVGKLVLTRTYSGYLGFAEFVADFEKGGGKRRFLISEFPDEAPELRRMGIKYVTVAYTFKNHGPVLQFYELASEQIPEVIASCWE